MSDLAVPDVLDAVSPHESDAVAPATEETVPEDLTDEELLDALVWHTLSTGMTRPRPVTLATQLKRPQDRYRIGRLINSAAFATAVFRAKRDMVVYTTDQIKTWLPMLAKEMLTVALQNDDLRCKVVALKDLKDRGGMSATQKLSLSTPSAYQQAIAELIEQPTDEPAAPIEMED